ncbi:type II secretion system protein [Luteibacter aegosomatissinici]|uniref:type II secretion system protein n=1 Tax=Luteibacter aegosomatissinici TaxID=2911539 RepID=UPI001FF927B0|nr:hypothetical protein [Luteibacter aegosomatissinici]UPG96273.1 hypothetical protein L2Y97_09240 [Luteibacter aegosomatissinici]
MTLIELVVALAIAAMVSAVVATGSSALASQLRRHLAMVRHSDGPGDALAGILADIRSDPDWTACLPAYGCPAYVGSSHGMAVVANGHAWAIHDRGLRTCFRDRCELALAGVSSLQVVVDTHDGAGIRRAEARPESTRGAHRIEIRLWLAEGGLRSRSAWLAR